MKLEVDEKQGFSITSLRETTLLMNLDHENILNVTEIVVGEHKRFRLQHFPLPIYQITEKTMKLVFI